MQIDVPRTHSTAAARAVKGGATMISQCAESLTKGKRAKKYARASACVLYIFQFPAITGRRIRIRPIYTLFVCPRSTSSFPLLCFLCVLCALVPSVLRFYGLFVSASTPGNFLPARNSSEAPPPVEMCEILSASSAAGIAPRDYPAPTMDVAPLLVAAATARAILVV